MTLSIYQILPLNTMAEHGLIICAKHICTISSSTCVCPVFQHLEWIKLATCKLIGDHFANFEFFQEIQQMEVQCQHHLSIADAILCCSTTDNSKYSNQDEEPIHKHYRITTRNTWNSLKVAASTKLPNIKEKHLLSRRRFSINLLDENFLYL